MRALKIKLHAHTYRDTTEIQHLFPHKVVVVFIWEAEAEAEAESPVARVRSRQAGQPTVSGNTKFTNWCLLT